MKINNQNLVQNITVKSDTSTSGKGMHELEQGDKFKATVIDIQPNKVTLRFNSGDTLTAKSLVLPEARIGEEAVFLVKENAKGQVLLEMFKPEGQLPVNFIKEALTGAGLYATEENIELVGQMIKNELPIDAETLHKAVYFKHLGGGLELDKILFLLKENFKADPVNVELLNGIMDKTLRLSDNLKNAAELLFDNEIFESLGRNAALAMLGSDISELDAKDPFSKEALKDMIKSKLFINLKDKPLENLNDFYKEVYKAVIKAKESLNRSAAELRGKLNASVSKLADELTHVLENLEFTNHITNYKEYLQIPFIYNETKNQGELYIFKDKKGRKNFNEEASVLITMDYAVLGHVEIFIAKKKNALNFQFKAEDTVLRMISSNTKKLSEALQSHGFTVSGIGLKKLEEPFSVTNDIESTEKKDSALKRFSFDMRV